MILDDIRYHIDDSFSIHLKSISFCNDDDSIALQLSSNANWDSTW